MKKFFDSIIFKISATVTTVILLITIVCTWFIIQQEKKLLDSELQQKGEYLSEILSQQLVEPILYEERYTIYSLLQSSMNTENGLIVFGEVYDSDGNVIVNLNKEKFNLPSIEPEKLLSINDNIIKKYDNLQIYEIIKPIIIKNYGSIGYLRIGVTKRHLIENIENIKRRLIFFLFIVTGFGITLGTYISKKIINPLVLLNQTVKRVSQGELGAKVEIIGYGEIKELSLAFNEMSTKIKELVHSIKNAQENLIRAEKFYALGEFSAAIAHEIKNPLTSIKMLMQTVKEEGTSLNPTDINIIEGEINRIDKIVKDFLAFARPIKSELSPVSINEIVKEIVLLSKPKIEQAQLNLIEQYDDKQPVVKACSDSLKQVFLNIILNAIQAMNPEGTLVVETFSDSNTVTINIQDTGCGIPEEYMDRIFDPFFTTKNEGTGMGLAIVKNIIIEHGGEIRVTSKIGNGTIVSVILPLLKNGGIK